MSEQPTFSLAVVKGVSAGRTLRSARKRISVGSAKDNDLVVADPDVAPRHFLVLIDGARWRVHSLSDHEQVAVDKRWAHPDSGRRGALLTAGGAEIILYPGALDQRTVEREIQARRGPSDEAEMATSINLPRPALIDAEAANEPTVAVRVADPTATPTAGDPADMDLLEMAQMPTLAGERPPDELRAAAQQMLQQRRGPVAPSVLRETTSDVTAESPIEGGRRRPVDPDLDAKTLGANEDARTGRPGRSRWEQARRRPTAPRTDESLPEVLAEPESQVMPAVPGGGSSVMTERPDFAKDADAEVIPFDGDRRGPSPKRSGGGRRTNAWGDASSRAMVPTRSEEERKNAWGDPGERAARKPKRSAWGDEGRGGGRSSVPPGAGAAPPPPASALAPTEGVANSLELASLAGRMDPALDIVNHPDGSYATQVRLLGAKIEEYAKNLGYRAYMVSSPEPLTGKTTSACNLAFALAEDTQRRVALLEANFRYPRFAEILGMDERTGIMAVLEGRSRLHEVGFKLSDRNLVVLPAGGRHPTPAEVLASPRFKALVAELVDTVDIAIIDAPSVTPFADANLILPLVDAAFLVVAERQTKRAWLGRAVGQLGESRILGSLFNRIPSKTLKVLKKERKERLRSKG